MHNTAWMRIVILLAVVALAACGDGERPPAGSDDWIPLFNGRDLEGWTPKITGQALGEDPLGTFRVEDGLLTVGYEAYDGFQGRFGHLFWAESLSRYRLRVEYRFVGEQVAGGPGWAWRNSGVMFHAQSPETMTLDQDFPISLEAQFLGGNGTDARPTANLCTPGTHVVMEEALVDAHCVTAQGPTIHGDAWVTVELEVLGDSLITHLVDGDTVLRYSRPAVGGGNVDGHDESVKVDGTPLSGGYIALQSESHPVQFRSVMLRRLRGPS